jgi:hypothetical protein
MSFPRRRESRKIIVITSFISVSITKRCGKLVQHDKEKSGFPPSRE